MKPFIALVFVAIVGLGYSGTAWSQQGDLEVTMDVVPANASTSGAGEIKLPFALPEGASARGQEASAFGQGTAAKARATQGDLGRDFGQSVSETARQRTHDSNAGGKGKGKGP